MAYSFLDIAVTPSVRTVQTAMGVAHVWDNLRTRRKFDGLGADEVTFISERNSFYISTVSEIGWPYVQHRGGPAGFLRIIDDRTLAFADYRGNLQYISAGNLAANDRACLFLMDYPSRTRLKIFAYVEILTPEFDPLLLESVLMVGYEAKIERIFRLRVEAFDWNCPQHITPRFTEGDVSDAVKPLRERLTQLETENVNLRTRLGILERQK